MGSLIGTVYRGQGKSWRRRATRTGAPSVELDFTALAGSMRDGFGRPLVGTRAGPATQFSATGQLTWAPSNVIRCSDAGMATPGIIGAGGAAPANWVLGVVNGVTRTITSAGRLPDGRRYLDLKLDGSNAGAFGNLDVYFDAPVAAPAVQGQAWAMSIAVARHPGFVAPASSPNAGAIIAVAECGAGGSYINSSSTTSLASLDSLTRTIITRTMESSATAYVRSLIQIPLDAGESINMTIRICEPQLQQAPSTAEYILTSGSAVYSRRIDFEPATLTCAGILLEEGRTNSLLNSAAVGAASGTPGTVPAGWSISSVAGVTTSIAVGVEDGMPYLDLTWSGSNASGAQAFPTVQLGATAGSVSAGNGQAWAGSVYARKLAGSDNSSSMALTMRGRATGTLVGGQAASSAIAGGESLRTSRHRVAFTFTNPGITHTELVLTRTLAISESIDITIRLALPQLELGAFATSAIPTYGSAAARAPDPALLTPFHSDSVQLEEGSMLVKCSVPPMPASVFPALCTIGDGTAANRAQAFVSSTAGSTCNAGLRIDSSSVLQVNSVSLPAVPVDDVRLAASWSATGFAIAVNGAGLNTGTISSITAIQNPGFYIGQTGPAMVVNARWIKGITYWPRRLTNAELIKASA